ncbi:MAG TPA: hypothetical protein VFU05_13505 [Cyclobacteriaceae bacterium]|nr:hypothetical protein [Cyclobacteriaceae bacterium]
MKKSFSILGMLMLISSVVLAGGIDNPLVPSNMAIVKTNTGARVFYSTEKSSKVRIRIYDTDDKEVFSDVIKSKENFSRLYNLKNLPEGEYRVVMEDENGIREELFSTRKKVEVLSSIIYSKTQQKCLVTFFSQDEADVSVTLLDKNKKVLASDELSVNGQAAKLFNLEQLKGPVTVEVSNANGIVRTSVIGN